MKAPAAPPTTSLPTATHPTVPSAARPAEDRRYPTRPWVGVGAVIFKGEAVLLARRARPPRAGMWSLPGGAQHLGEAAEAAVRRELLEETGLAAGPLQVAAVVDAVNHDEAGRVLYHYTIIDYCGAWAAGEARPGDDADAIAWAEPEALPGYALTEEVLAVIARARSLLALG